MHLDVKTRIWIFLMAGGSCTLTGWAVLDRNGNGISDVYEDQYGLTGQEVAESDLDGDDLTLKQEYLLGTNPNVFDASPVLFDGFTVSLSSHSATYAFRAHEGLRYGIEYVENMVSNKWTLGEEVLGTGTLVSYVDPTTETARYYRLKALGALADADGDGLDSREEALVGSSPNSNDTDADGLPDGFEAVSEGHDASVPGSHTLAPMAYFEHFEDMDHGLLDGQDEWKVSDDTQALAQRGTAYTGLQGIQLTGLNHAVEIEKYFDGVGVSNVWVDVYLLPGGTDADPAVIDLLAATAAYFTGDGHLRAYDGTGQRWVEDSFGSGVDTLEWRRLTLFLDYPHQQWLVYVNGELVNSAPGGTPSFFGFSNPSPFFYRFSIGVSGKGNELYMDDLSVSTTAPVGLDVLP